MVRLPRVRIVGDVAVVRMFDERFEGLEREIGEEILRRYRRVRTVLRVYGVRGNARIPDRYSGVGVLGGRQPPRPSIGQRAVPVVGLGSSRALQVIDILYTPSPRPP